MSRNKQMTVAEKSSILTLQQENISVREIARRVGYNEAAVRRFLKKYEETGSLERKKGSGPKRKTTAREDRHLKLLSLENRFATATDLRKELAGTSFENISDRTIQRRLNEEGLRSCRPAKKPLLTRIMKRRRLTWATDLRNWTVTDWSRVIFSDESKFNLFGRDGRQNVRRRKNERFKENCISPTVKHSPYIMVWGCITSHGVGPIYIVQGMMNAEKYKNTVRNFILPTIEDMTQYIEDPLFQDDSAPCHRARSVTDLKETLGINSLSWPGNSPDLNPIENLWSFLAKRIREAGPKTLEDMKSVIQRVWEHEIPEDFIQNLYISMPKRIQQVIKAKGGHTKY